MKIIDEEYYSGLSVNEVKKRVDKEVDLLREKYGGSISKFDLGWRGDVLAGQVGAFGMKGTVNCTVEADRVSASLDLPWALTPARGKIANMLAFRLERVCKT